jgi:ubiquinone biosynthesis monooxygenase Coq6
LADAESLAKCITGAIKYGADVGSRTTLADYPRERYFANHMMTSATDKLQKLYGTRLRPIVWARSVGLEVVNEWTGLKGGLMRVAGGSGEPGRRHGGDGGLIWTAAGSGVEAISAVFDTGRTLAGVVGNLIVERRGSEGN